MRRTDSRQGACQATLSVRRHAPITDATKRARFDRLAPIVKEQPVEAMVSLPEEATVRRIPPPLATNLRVEGARPNSEAAVLES